MAKRIPALDTLLPAAGQALPGLGQNLSIARLRRRESQRERAGRLGCSVPTLIRLERRAARSSAWAAQGRLS
jgi:hypothetical protein